MSTGTDLSLYRQMAISCVFGVYSLVGTPKPSKGSMLKGRVVVNCLAHENNSLSARKVNDGIFTQHVVGKCSL